MNAKLVNAKLVESLAEAIAALPTEDYALFQETLIAKIVRKTPGVCGGYARIRDTRIAVWTLISLANQGADDDELLRNFPVLTPFDLIAARSYYATHPTEIDPVIASHQEEDHADG